MAAVAYVRGKKGKRLAGNGDVDGVKIVDATQARVLGWLLMEYGVTASQLPVVFTDDGKVLAGREAEEYIASLTGRNVERSGAPGGDE